MLWQQQFSSIWKRVTYAYAKGGNNLEVGSRLHKTWSDYPLLHWSRFANDPFVQLIVTSGVRLVLEQSLCPLRDSRAKKTRKRAWESLGLDIRWTPGGTHERFVRRGSARRFKPLPFNILVLIEMVPFIYLEQKLQPFYASKISQKQ